MAKLLATFNLHVKFKGKIIILMLNRRLTRLPFTLTVVLFRLNKVLFRLTGVLFRLTGVLFRLTRVLFRLTGALFGQPECNSVQSKYITLQMTSSLQGLHNSLAHRWVTDCHDLKRVRSF